MGWLAGEPLNTLQQCLVDTLAPELAPGDLVLCLGAGDITKWAARLPDELQAAREQVNA